MSRKIEFANDEFYHIYNRGVDKRNVFLEKEDLNRFLNYLALLNNQNPIVSLHSYSYQEKKSKAQLRGEASKLVDIVCFCLNPNHYHFLVKQKEDKGISKFMHRLGTAYTMYFNDKYERSGVLFQGVFKAKHIESNDYLLYLSAYVNLNFEVHNKWSGTDKPMTYSSWNEYLGKPSLNLCHKDIIQEQFSSVEEYKKYAKEALILIKAKKEDDKVLADYLLE